MAEFFVVETVAIAPQGANGYRRVFLACAGKASAEWHCETQEKKRGFDSRWYEVSEAEYNAIYAGERNDFLPTNKLPQR